MLDWRVVVFGSLWVIGAGLALAFFSHAISIAGIRSKALIDAIKRSSYQIGFSSAAVFLCVGLAGLSTEIWRQIGWILLAGVWGGVLIKKWRQ